MNRVRFTAAAISLAGFFLHYILKAYYRPFIYSNPINDLHLGDTFPSLLSVPVIYSFTIVFSPTSASKKLYIAILTAASLLYEVKSATFDLMDIIAILIGTLIAFGLRYLFLKQSKRVATLSAY